MSASTECCGMCFVVQLRILNSLTAPSPLPSPSPVPRTRTQVASATSSNTIYSNMLMDTMRTMLPNRHIGGSVGAKPPPAGAMICSLHNKTRGPNNVEPTFPGSNQWRCKVGSECKMPDSMKIDGPTPPGNVTCVTHGKTRGPNNVEQTFPGSGVWKCKMGSECKVPAELPPRDGPIPPGSVVCSLHNKTRGPNNVTPIPGSHLWRCRQDSECKMPANPSDNKHDNSGPTQTCSIHNKVRGPNNVEQTYPGSGIWKCKPGSSCKMAAGTHGEVPGQAPIHPSEPSTCWAHAKKRSPNQLHQVNTPFGPQWECLPQFKCKGTAGAPAQAAVQAGGHYPMATVGMDHMFQHAMLMHQQNMQSMQLGQLGMGKGHGV